MARDWHTAPYRKAQFLELVSELVNRNESLAKTVEAAIKTWTPPNSEKERIEFHIRAAQLQPRNFTSIKDTEGEERSDFRSGRLDELIEAFQQANKRPQQVLAFPGVCRQFLSQNAQLTPENARVVADLMVAVDGGETIELEDEHLKPARVAAAAALLLRGREWLAQNSYIADRANVIMRAALDETALEAGRARHHYGVGPSYLEFAAFLVFENWLASPGPETDRELTLMLISGDDSAANVIASLAFLNATRWAHAGGACWNCRSCGLDFSSSRRASATRKKPQGRDGYAGHDGCLRETFRVKPSSVDRVVPLAVAERVEKIEAIQWRERYARDRRPFDRKIDTRISGGLETHFLEIVFGWLLDEFSLPSGRRARTRGMAHARDAALGA